MPTSAFYDTDIDVWCAEQASALRAGAGAGADPDTRHLADEFEGMRTRDRAALASHLEGLLCALLVRHCRPAAGADLDWTLTVTRDRDIVIDLLDNSQTLRRELPALVERLYPAARHCAAARGHLREDDLPPVAPWSAERLLDPDVIGLG
ncbi:MAG: DUF29 domain-containing protein [Alphaproteobacteria bacterium]